MEVEDSAGESFCGVIKSYNERRGFGFILCEETAQRFGRDVYLSKEEAAALTKEPVVGENSAGEAVPPVREGDCLLFKVQRSMEGFPQAVSARRIRRLRGSVLRAPEKGADGIIIVQGSGSESEAHETYIKRLIGAEVLVRQADCGQLWLMPNDEVAFCATNSGCAQMLEAQLVELLRTDRGVSSLLGCFTLELPRASEQADVASESMTACEGTHAASTSVVLDGHALIDRVVFAGIPPDLGGSELMRLFSKLGASEAIVTNPEGSCDSDAATGFASIFFGGPVDVARLLCRAAHTISEQGATQLARLGPCRVSHIADEHVAVLPALPVPTLSAVDDGALLVQWSQVGLAAGYLVELRPVGNGSPWSPVTAASAGRPQDAAHGLPGGLLGAQCSACRVSSTHPGVPYEARVTYLAACGCRSQASACSAPLASEKSAAPTVLEAPSAAVQVPKSTMSVAPPLQALQPPSLTTAAETRGTYQVGGGASPSWRCAHGSLVPAPAMPEVVPGDDELATWEATRGIVVQWPTVIHAAAYVVELLEEGASTPQRFTRALPESVGEALVELRVGNLQRHGYAACVRCIAPCGCESAPSPWSYLHPFWSSPAFATTWQAPLSQSAASAPETSLGAYLPSTSSALLSTSPPPPGAKPLAAQGGMVSAATFGTTEASTRVGMPGPPPPPEIGVPGNATAQTTFSQGSEALVLD